MARAALLDVVPGQDEVDEGLGLHPMGVREQSSSAALGGHLFPGLSPWGHVCIEETQAAWGSPYLLPH